MMNTRRLFGLQHVFASLIFSWALDAIVAISHTAKRTKWGPARRKATVIYNGVDVDRIQSAGRGVHTVTGKIVVVGRVRPGKKQHVVISALRVLRDSGVHATLEIIGGPTDSSNGYYRELEELVDQLGLRNQVRFTGWISPPFASVAEAEIVVNCSTVEGFGYVVVEAMALGKPVVVASLGAPSELVTDGHCGVHFRADDPNSLASVLKRLLADAGLRRRLGEAAETEARRRFGVGAHMEGLRSLFERMAAS